MKFLAVTACPSGVAHTYMAAEAIQQACEKAGVPIVGYNVSMIATAPTQALTSASIDWGPYYTYAVKSVIDGTKIDTDWCKGYDDGADKITKQLQREQKKK